MTDTHPTGEIVLFQSEDGQTKIQVRIEERTVWLSQRQIAELYQVSVKTVNEHIVNIYDEGELQPEATIRKFRIVQTEGTRRVERLVDHYSLDAILAVGYRVRSLRGTQFRQWATNQLRELLTKGFVLDDERLKEGRSIGQDYFDELLARIRDIRTSERRFYQKITDIYATSIDYDSKAEITQAFYAIVQNKLHWAIHGMTAAEIIKSRADATKSNMGLTNWKNSPKGAIRAERRSPMHMADWVKKLDDFLKFNEQNILTHAGTVSHKLAQEPPPFKKEELNAISATVGVFGSTCGSFSSRGKCIRMDY